MRLRPNIVFAMMLLAAGADAQWSTNYWPSWEHPRHTVPCLAQVASGVIERAYACDYAEAASISGPTFWRLKRSTVVDLKGHLKEMITDPDNNVSFTWIPRTSFVASAYSGPMPIAKLTVTNLCQMACLPTNYFDYTPWRFLAGIGTFTNDATVGHGHGYVTAETLAGGTNFPAGRTNWYTHDYGVDGLTNVIHHLWALNLGQSGYLSIYTNDLFGSSTLWGYGATPAEALGDLSSSWSNQVTNAASTMYWGFGGASYVRWGGTCEETATNFTASITDMVKGEYDFAGHGLRAKIVAKLLGWTGTVDRVDFYMRWACPFNHTNITANNIFGFDADNAYVTSLWETVTAPDIATVGSAHYVQGDAVWFQNLAIPNWSTNWCGHALYNKDTIGLLHLIWE